MSAAVEKTELRQAVEKLRPYFALSLGISFFMSILYLAPMGYMRDIYGPVIDSRSLPNLIWVTLLLMLLLISTGVLDWIRQRIFLAASVSFSNDLSFRIFDATFRADLQKIRGSTSGLLDLRTIRNFIASPMMGIMFDAPFGLLFLVLVFAIHPTMGYLATLGALLTLVLGLWTEKRVRPLMSKAIENANRANAAVSDAGRNAQVVQAMGMIGNVRSRWLAIQNKYLSQQASASMEQAVGSATSRIVMLVQGSSLLGVGTLLTLIGHLPTSAGAYLIIAKMLGAMAVRPTMQLIMGWKQLVSVRESYDRLNNFLHNLPAPPQRMPMPAPNGHLIVAGAAARPPGTKLTVAYDISFQVLPGQILAVVGPSGSGKSSLARLLVGSWRPLVGSVRLDGVEISGWDKQDLGPYIGYLPQDVQLFEGTIAQNIARFGDISPQALERVVKLTGLDDMLTPLRDGIHSEIGDGGEMLSGGQRQRVGIARALYGDPRLIVMDEPNSNLDEAGELSLATAVIEMKKAGSAIVVITHRKELLNTCDLMLVMMEGKSRIFGAREKVIQEIKRLTLTRLDSEGKAT